MTAERGGSCTFRVLRLGVTVCCDSDRLARHLRSVVQTAWQPVEVERTVRYDVTRTATRGYVIERDGEPFEVEFDPAGVVGRLGRDIRRQALAMHKRGALVAAAVGTYRGERFLLVGETRRARAGIARDLLKLGAVVEVDDACVVEGGLVTADPVGLRAIDPRAGDSPHCSNASAKPDDIVVLELNLGGHGRLLPLPAPEAAREIVGRARGLGNPINAVREAAALTASARCWRLWLGSTEELPRLWPSAARSDTVPQF